MVVKDGAEVRRQRLQKLLDLIIGSNNPSISEKKVKSIFMLQTGLTMQKIDSYITDLIEAGLIERREDKLVFVSPV